MLTAGATLRAGELVTVAGDGSVWPTGWGVADPATAMTVRFWAVLEPQLERLARDTRAMWEHIKLLAIIDPERLPRDDWEATPHGLVATRSGERRPLCQLRRYRSASTDSSRRSNRGR
jgi:hypothetical protein